MTNDHFIAVARAFALIDGRAHLHAYLPRTEEEAALWDPHEWVIAALRAAFNAGQANQALVTEKAFEALNRNADLGETAEAVAEATCAALRELVALTDLRAEFEALGYGASEYSAKRNDYYRRKPLAWAIARALALGPND